MKHIQKKGLVILACITLLAAMLLCGCQQTPEGDSSNGYTITIKGLELAIGQTLDDVQGAYGAPVAYDESASCGGIPGKDYVYQYTGFTVKTTPAEGGKNVICLIELTDDTYETAEGLTIGSTADAVKKAMGNTDTATPTSLVYTKADMKLQFILRDGVVTNIQYLTK